jgi:hypothetical protein
LENARFHKVIRESDFGDSETDSPFIARAIEKLYVPYVQKAIVTLDLFSTDQVKQCVKSIQELEDYIDPSTSKFYKVSYTFMFITSISILAINILMDSF